MEDLVESMVAYERGELDANDTVILFQQLIDRGMTTRLQGHYGRTAWALIEAGLCKTDW
jgi:hypothetical protein